MLEVTAITNQVEDNLIISKDKNGNTLSNYSDNIWDLSPYIYNNNAPHSRRVVNFNLTLTNGTSLCEPENEKLYLSLKKFLYVRLRIKNPKSGKIASPQSLISIYYSLRVFIGYLISKKITCFSNVTPKIIDDYVYRLRVSHKSPSFFSRLLCVVEELYTFGEYLDDKINFKPWPNFSYIYLSGANCGYKNQTKIIPDHLCSKIFTLCINNIREHSAPIISISTSINDLIDENWDEQIKKDTSKAKKIPQKKYSRTEYLILRKVSVYKKISEIIKDNGYNNRREFTKKSNELRTCCYIIIALLSGMRNSEISSLSVNCFSKSVGWDNEEYCWLNGLTYKLEDTFRETKWMIPECVELAINHLSKINLINKEYIKRSLPFLTQSEYEDQQKKMNLLFICNDYTTSLFTSISNTHFNKSLEIFSYENGLIEDPNDKEPQPWILTSHQFRRTFATLAARSALGDLRYLREHMKHWSLDMTLYYAKNKTYDENLFDDVLTERNELQKEIISGWLVKDMKLKGGKGSQIIELKSRGDIKTAKNLVSFIQQVGDSVFIRGTGHSWCLATGNGCGGEGLYDALKCTNCQNAVIDKTHIPAWEGLKKQHIEILTLPDIGVSTKQYALDIIKFANSIVKIKK